MCADRYTVLGTAFTVTPKCLWHLCWLILPLYTHAACILGCKHCGVFQWHKCLLQHDAVKACQAGSRSFGMFTPMPFAFMYHCFHIPHHHCAEATAPNLICSGTILLTCRCEHPHMVAALYCCFNCCFDCCFNCKQTDDSWLCSRRI